MRKDFCLNDFEIRTILKQCSAFNLVFDHYEPAGITSTSYTSIDIFNLDDIYCGSISSSHLVVALTPYYKKRSLTDIINYIKNTKPRPNGHTFTTSSEVNTNLKNQNEKI